MSRARPLPGTIAATALLAVLVIAVVSGDRSPDPDPPGPRADAPVVGEPDARSAAWYCAGGTSESGGYAPGTVRVTNLGDEDVDAIVRVLPGRDEEPAELAMVVEPYTVADVAVADVLATAEPGVVVETYGGSTFVEHELSVGDDVAVTPCASSASTEWVFASGTTAQGAEQYLVLFNPFQEDASVDVSFVTETGLSQPERLQGFTVPRTARISIPIHDEVSRAEFVGTRVTSRTGRIVAEQILILDGSDTVAGREGIAVSLGSSALDEEWMFPWAGPLGGTDDGIAVANFGTESGELTMSVSLDGEATLEDQTVPVPPRTVTFVEVASRVPAELGAAITIRTSPDIMVVAEQLASEGARLATMVGRRGASSSWAFSDLGDAIAIFNPGTEAVDVEVRSASGDPLLSATIVGGERREVSADEIEGSDDDPVVIEAGAPVIAVRVGSLTVSPGLIVR